MFSATSVFYNLKWRSSCLTKPHSRPLPGLFDEEKTLVSLVTNDSKQSRHNEARQTRFLRARCEKPDDGVVLKFSIRTGHGNISISGLRRHE